MHFSTTKDFFITHERTLSWAALATGFIVDSLTLSRIDLWLDNIILSSYLFIAGMSIVLIHHLKVSSRVQLFLPYTLQYAFGGLFSGFIIFYSRSGTLIENWPFLIILITLLFGNEFFKEKYKKYVFHVSIYFIALFSFFIFFIPVLIGKMGPFIFILSGAVSLIFIILLITLIENKKKEENENHRRYVYTSVISIYILFTLLYFTNSIPPIPLSLKNIGVYSSVERVQNNYILLKEKNKWFSIEIPKRVHITKESSLYVYSSIFAPTKITEPISHIWLYKTDDGWEKQSTIPFSISGGRDEGYRGYTMKESLREGLWKVEVRTERGQLIGRETFLLIYRDTLPPQERVIQ